MSTGYVHVVDENERKPGARGGGPAFLLAQVGGHAAMKFAERITPLELTPPHAGILRAISASAGQSQQALSATLGILPSRLVLLVDELEERGLVERRASPTDRRTHALYLTARGRETLEALGQAARRHNDAICAALDDTERKQLASLLARIAEEQGLTPGVHPGFRRLSDAPADTAARPKKRARRPV
jgi:DNA-binding MarR family transcriptional regulator